MQLCGAESLGARARSCPPLTARVEGTSRDDLLTVLWRARVCGLAASKEMTSAHWSEPEISRARASHVQVAELSGLSAWRPAIVT